ncbi:MAG: MFS transporter [Methanobrevibacter sp.]|nr:MFS transporter [Methanobrevibacter sp.]
MKSKIHIVTVYSIIHFIVDFSCAFLIANLIVPLSTSEYTLIMAVLVYNFFAFALQLPIGIIADKLNKNALVSSLGCLLIIIGFAFFKFSILSCIIIGLGNACFHIGGGIDILNISKKKAKLLGIYVAPGAMGLFFGGTLGLYGFNQTSLVIIALLLSAIALVHLYFNMKNKYKINNLIPQLETITKKHIIILSTLLFAVCIRAYLGLILTYTWKSDIRIGFIFVLCIVLGKVLGGFISDKFGLIRTAVISLCLSAIFFLFSFNSEIMGILAIFTFNISMPITLIGLANTFNNNKGFAFGLTTFALFLGAVPVLLKFETVFFNPISLFIIIIITTIILYMGLKSCESLGMSND